MIKRKLYLNSFGFTLIEGIITILIIGILVGLGSRMLITSANNYSSQREINRGSAENYIIYDRIIYSYLTPLFRIFQKPLFLSSDNRTVIFATSKSAFNQPLILSKTYLSQLVKIDHKPDNTLKITLFTPPNIESDILYTDNSDFLDISNTSEYATEQIIADNISQFSIQYFDALQNITSDRDLIVTIVFDLSLTRNGIYSNRSAVIAPWKTLWK